MKPRHPVTATILGNEKLSRESPLPCFGFQIIGIIPTEENEDIRLGQDSRICDGNTTPRHEPSLFGGRIIYDAFNRRFSDPRRLEQDCTLRICPVTPEAFPVLPSRHHGIV